jgi:hypothetical protein
MRHEQTLVAKSQQPPCKLNRPSVADLLRAHRCHRWAGLFWAHFGKFRNAAVVDLCIPSDTANHLSASLFLIGALCSCGWLARDDIRPLTTDRDYGTSQSRAPRFQLRHSPSRQRRPKSTRELLDHIQTCTSPRQHGSDSQYLCLLDALRLVVSRRPGFRLREVLSGTYSTQDFRTISDSRSERISAHIASNNRSNQCRISITP